METNPKQLDWSVLSVYAPGEKDRAVNALQIKREGALFAFNDPEVTLLPSGGFIISLRQGVQRFQVGEETDPLPSGLLGSPKGLAVFLIDEEGICLSGVRMCI